MGIKTLRKLDNPIIINMISAVSDTNQTLYTTFQQTLKDFVGNYQINIFYRYCRRSIQEFNLNFCELAAATYNNCIYAINNPMSIVILLITYGIIFLV